MDCPRVQEQLSGYMESSLAAEQMEQVGEHLKACPQCSDLLNEMRSVVKLCQSFPSLEINLDVVDRILLRTSGRPRRRSFREQLKRYLAGPLRTPRFAVGAGLAALFVVLLANYAGPRIPAALSGISPAEVFQVMDRGVQRLYGQGLKAYDKTNEWQAQFNYFKNNTVNKLLFLIERIDVPLEGRKKSEEPGQRKERAPAEKRSGLPLLPA